MNVSADIEKSAIAVDGVNDENGFSCSNHSDEDDGTYVVTLSQSDSEPQQEKDSGVDCGSDACDMPDEETASKIRQIVEYYLSDANILNDQFLLKHVKRNKEGYVSLKLLSSFRKVRSLCRNHKAVAYSLQKSDVLSLSADGSKVRRLAPLPNQNVPTRTVVVCEVAEGSVSIESVSEMFSKCGEMSLLKLHRAGNPTSPEFRMFFSKHADAHSKNCCLVEFVVSESAQSALSVKAEGVCVLPFFLENRTCDQQNSTNGHPTLPKESPRKKKRSKRVSSYPAITTKRSESSSSFSKCPDVRRSSSGSVSFLKPSYHNSSPLSDLSSSPNDSSYLRRHSYHPTTTSTFASFRNCSYRNKTHGRTEGNGNPSRFIHGNRDQTRREEVLSRTESSTWCATTFIKPVKTIRLPKGPDGTIGFHSRTVLSIVVN